jgi:hypothetical protein
MRYTAREGGALLRTAAVNSLNSIVSQSGTAGLGLFFSLRHDFPTEWAAFVNSTTNAPFTATVRRNYFPYFTQGKTITIARLDLYGQDGTKHYTFGDPEVATNDLSGEAEQFTFTAKPDEPGLSGVLTRTASTHVFLIVRYHLEG